MHLHLLPYGPVLYLSTTAAVYFYVSECRGYGLEGVKALASMLRSRWCRGLRTLALEGCHLAHDHMAVLAQALEEGGGRELQTLSLPGGQHGDGGGAWRSCARLCPRLRELTLPHLQGRMERLTSGPPTTVAEAARWGWGWGWG